MRCAVNTDFTSPVLSTEHTVTSTAKQGRNALTAFRPCSAHCDHLSLGVSTGGSVATSDGSGLDEFELEFDLDLVGYEQLATAENGVELHAEVLAVDIGCC
ncbi:hypothetical protein SAMN04489751_0092 [Brevibacterium sandarakinum]|uniref:Uncharacterized protein n=1 Tax=Brevibacterium sandarakinum TaxID=629680 RepID=A0A1H1L443_BRESA|nr:hypothetical protein SAMN04489751_0092 [Brevibacterium sandarakinum]